MSLRRLWFVASAAAALAIGLLAVTQGGSRAAALTNCDTSTADLNAAESQMLALINGARASAGMAPLKASPGLNRAAAWKSADPSATGSGGVPFSHTDSLGRSPTTRAQQCAYPGQAAENIAFGFGSAQATFDAWMASGGHRCNINGTVIPGHDPGECPAAFKSLVAGYKVLGVGQVGSAWTVDFGSVDDSGAPPPPPPPPNPTTPSGGGGSASTATQSLPTSTPTAVQTPTPVPTVAAPVGVFVSLSAGENLVTYVGAEQPVTFALRLIADKLVAVYEWDPAQQRWLRFSPGKPGYVNSFTTMKPGGVYSLELSGGGIWAY